MSAQDRYLRELQEKGIAFQYPDDGSPVRQFAESSAGTYHPPLDRYRSKDGEVVSLVEVDGVTLLICTYNGHASPQVLSFINPGLARLELQKLRERLEGRA